jgi:hypothetical protein
MPRDLPIGNGTLLAALGIGSIIAAIIDRSAAISNHRQNWINELREDLATFLKEIDVLHYRMSRILEGNVTTAMIEDLEENKQEARNSAMLADRRILNATKYDGDAIHRVRQSVSPPP